MLVLILAQTLPPPETAFLDNLQVTMVPCTYAMLAEVSVFLLAGAGIVGCPEAMMTASRKQNHILNNSINAPRGNNCRADFLF